jgi:hypothetical protein
MMWKDLMQLEREELSNRKIEIFIQNQEWVSS